jgi:hypothetical protein
LELDVGGGVKRRVRVDELARIYNERDKLVTAKQALDESLAEQGDLQHVRQIRDRIANLDGSRRQRILQLLESDDPDPAPADDAADELDRAFNNGTRRRAPADGVQPNEELRQLRAELAELRPAVQALASRENTRIREERKVTTSDLVDAAMKQYPIFAQEEARHPAIVGMTKRSIMTELLNARAAAGGQGVDLEAVVQEAASVLQGYRQKAEQAVLEGAVVPRQMAGVTIPKGGFKGQDLRSGAVRAAAARILGAAR